MTKILSQEEIDALLRGMDDGELPTQPEEKIEAGIVAYDLTNQDRIIRGRMPAMEIINDHFCRMVVYLYCIIFRMNSKRIISDRLKNIPTIHSHKTAINIRSC